MKTAMQALLGAVIGFSFVYIAVFAGIDWSLSQIGIALLTLVLSFPLHILLHELGHVLCGYSQGMRMLNISVGPIVLERHKEKWHVHYSPSVLAYAGRAMMFFPDHLPKEQMKRKLIVYLVGGSAANVLTGLLFIGSGFFMIDHYMPVIIGMSAIFLGFSNLIPEYNNAVSTDGFAIKQLRKGDVQNSLMVSTFSILTESIKKRSPREWSRENVQELVRMMKSDADDPRTSALMSYIAYYYLPENPDVVIRAGKRYAFAERERKKNLLQDLTDIYAITALVFKGEFMEREDVRRALEQIGEVDKVTVHKKQAFIHMLNGNDELAIQELESAIRALGKWNPLYLRGEEEKALLAALIQKVQERKRAVMYLDSSVER